MNLSDQLCAIARSLRCQFTLQGQKLSYERVFAPDGLLPAIIKKGDQLATFCLGYDLGGTIVTQNDAMLGVRIELNDQVSNTLRLMCALDVVIELVQNGPSRSETPVDELINV